MGRNLSFFFIVIITAMCHMGDGAANSRRYMTLQAECTDTGLIVASLNTMEPFSGLIYSRNHPSSCRVAGDNASPTVLVMQDQACGFRVETRRGQAGVREVDVYVQQDSLVQQVIDEQFLVQCFPGSKKARVSYLSRQTSHRNNNNNHHPSFVRDVTVTSKFAGRSNNQGQTAFNLPHIISAFTGDTKVAKLVETNLEVVAEPPVWLEKRLGFVEDDEDAVEEAQTLASSRPKLPQNSGWMELVWPINSKEIMEGQNVTLVVRLQQTAESEAMISSCTAFAEGPDGVAKKDLTDLRGCSLDHKVMPNFAISLNPQTNIKALKSVFPIFKFPHQDRRLHVQCSVLVCHHTCPARQCEQNMTSNDRDLFASITETFTLSTYVDVADSVSTTTTTTIKQETVVLTPTAVPKANLIVKANSLTQEEVDEAEEALVEMEVLQKTPQDNGLLCLTPSKLIVAFSVILLVLLLALIFSCMLWLRARSGLARTRHLLPKPHPGPLMSPPPPGHLRAGPHGHPRPRPVIVPRGRMPYIRVMQ